MLLLIGSQQEGAPLHWGMDALLGELRESVLLLNADLVRGKSRPGDAVWLAGESPTRLERSDAVPLVSQLLADLGRCPWYRSLDDRR